MPLPSPIQPQLTNDSERKTHKVKFQASGAGIRILKLEVGCGWGRGPGDTADALARGGLLGPAWETPLSHRGCASLEGPTFQTLREMGGGRAVG